MYSATGDKPDDKNLASADVLADPYFERVTLAREFLKVPHLENVITDSHCARRDRMGRTLGFLARIMKDGWSSSPREVAIDEKSAVLVEADGKATCSGHGEGGVFLAFHTGARSLRERSAPYVSRVSVFTDVPAGGHFDLPSWTGEGGTAYSLSVVQGKIESTQIGKGIY